MSLSLAMLTWDAADPAALGGWWAEQLGAQTDDPWGGEFVLVRGGALPLVLAFQRVGDPTPGKNRLHVDLTADDVEAEVDRLVAAGATLVGHRGEEGFRWVTLADPAGNEFCVASSHDDPEG